MSLASKSEIRNPQSEISIVFMGTATFAVPTLQKLFEKGYKIAGVITQPDKPGGRGQTFTPSPVKQKAFELHLPVHQLKSLKDNEAHALFEALIPQMIIVVAYGKILPLWLLELPEHGCINLHGSLLPQYRGAAPVHWAIANGETKTGVCAMRLDEGLDTGPLFLCEETSIGPEENVQQLYDRLAKTGSGLMIKTVEGILSGTLCPTPQDNAQATFAPILKKEHGFIEWTKPAKEIHNRVRAFNPWPGTVTKFRAGICKILRTRVAGSDPALFAGGERAEPGTIVVSKRSLTVICGNSVLLEILSIQPENRKPVSGADFANGARIQAGEKFQSVMDN
jgi:methionyl-tRNA formyltransferase